jgi:hypothetical protein
VETGCSTGSGTSWPVAQALAQALKATHRHASALPMSSGTGVVDAMSMSGAASGWATWRRAGSSSAIAAIVQP